jgi:excisionase family DNA binding protein
MAGTASPPGSNSRPGTREHGILTVIEVAAELRCSKAHVHNIITGKVGSLPPLPVLRIGRRVLIRREALLRWMEWLEGGGLHPVAGASARQ